MATRAANVIIRARDQASSPFNHINKATGGLIKSLGGLAVASLAVAGIGFGIAGVLRGVKDFFL